MLHRNENQNAGRFGGSPGTKTGTRVRSHVPPERKRERGYIRQNHPLMKPPFCLPVTLFRFSFPQEQKAAICRKTEEFYSDPVYTDPVQNFPIASQLLLFGPKPQKLAEVNNSEEFSEKFGGVILHSKKLQMKHEHENYVRNFAQLFVQTCEAPLSHSAWDSR